MKEGVDGHVFGLEPRISRLEDQGATVPAVTQLDGFNTLVAAEFVREIIQHVFHGGHDVADVRLR